MFSFTKLFDRPGIVSSVNVAPNNSQYIYVVQRQGLIYRINLTTYETVPILDISFRVKKVSETSPLHNQYKNEPRGLYAVAFHPLFNDSGSPFYRVFYTIESQSNQPDDYRNIDVDGLINVDHMSCLVQYRLSETLNETIQSGQNILSLPEPEQNNSMTDIKFATDGNLWISVGDGGGDDNSHDYRSDPYSRLGFAQDRFSLYGKLLRIEPIAPNELNSNIRYNIPKSNPYFNQPEVGRPEIVAYGFNNPTHINFDDQSRLWVAESDCNQSQSVCLITHLGGNYGWPATKGNNVINKEILDYIKQREDVLIPSLINYSSNGDFGSVLNSENGSIVGVIAYRGNVIANLKNRVIIADNDGTLRLATPTEHEGFKLEPLITLTDMSITSLNEDENGELYISLMDQNNGKGIVVRLDALSDRNMKGSILNREGTYVNQTTTDTLNYDPYKDDYNYTIWIVWIIIGFIFLVIIAYVLAYYITGEYRTNTK